MVFAFPNPNNDDDFDLTIKQLVPYSNGRLVTKRCFGPEKCPDLHFCNPGFQFIVEFLHEIGPIGRPLKRKTDVSSRISVIYGRLHRAGMHVMQRQSDMQFSEPCTINNVIYRYFSDQLYSNCFLGISM